MIVQNNNIASVLRDIVSQDAKLPNSSNIFNKLNKEVTNVIRTSLADWQYAYEDAINPLWYDREALLELYEQIEIDEHVSALIDTIYTNMLANGFQVLNANGDEDANAMRMFDKPWFSQFIALAIDAFTHGFNGMQFTGIEKDTFAGVKLIPRKHILPWDYGIRYNPYARKPDVLFADRALRNWTLLLCPQLPADQYQLGRFNKIAKLFILKRENLQFWAIFNELFGVPFRVMKTDVNDSGRKSNAISAMETMTSAAYSVIHDDDEIIFHNGVQAANTGTFNDLLTYTNKGMSKALVGSTMVLEEGSSLSQSEVHERNTDAFVVSYQRIVAQWINGQVIPRMAALGMQISENHTFKWDNTETLTKSQTVSLIAQLNSAGYKVPNGYVMEHTGIPVEEALPKQSVGVVTRDAQNRFLTSRIEHLYGLNKNIN